MARATLIPPPSPSSSSSMTLAISKGDAHRIIEASRCFNIRLNELQKEERLKLKEEWDAYERNLKEWNEKEKIKVVDLDGCSSQEEEAPSAVKEAVVKEEEDKMEEKESTNDSTSSTPPKEAASESIQEEKDGATSSSEEITATLQKITVKEVDCTSSSSASLEEVKHRPQEEEGKQEKEKIDESNDALRESSCSSIPSLKEEPMSDDDTAPQESTRPDADTAKRKSDPENPQDCDENDTNDSAPPESKEEESTEDELVEKESSPPSKKQKSTTDEPSNETNSPPKPPLHPITYKPPLPLLLLPAAQSCNNPFLQSFCASLTDMSLEEQRASVLLFLDMDKSSILLTAFSILGEPQKEDQKEVEREIGATVTESFEDSPQKEENQEEKKEETKNDDVSPPTEESKGSPSSSEDEDDYFELPPEGQLSYQSLIHLFQSLLTSISSCIHFDDETPPPQSPKLLKVSSPSIESVTFSPPPATAAVSQSMDEEEEERPRKAKKDAVDSSPTSAAVRAASSATATMSSPSDKATLSPKTLVTLAKAGATATDSTEQELAAATIAKSHLETPVTTLTPAPSSPRSRTGKQGRDWTRSSRIQREIHDIAVYAADSLMAFLEKHKESKSETNTKVKEEDAMDTTTTESTFCEKAITKKEKLVSFELFGEWYNAGGYALVPWLELLDLAKWDYAGRAAAAAAAERERVAAAEAASAAVISSAMHAPLDTPCAATTPRPRHREHDDDDLASIHAASMLDDFGASPHPLTPAAYNSAEHDLHRPHVHPRNSGGRPSPSLRRRPPSHHDAQPPTPNIFTRNRETSRTVVSFDFTASMPPTTPQQEFTINITEENLVMLKSLVHRTGLLHTTLEDISSILMRFSFKKRLEDEIIYVLKRDEFGKCIRDLVSHEYSKHFDEEELENYSNYFTNFFTCFEKLSSALYTAAPLGVDCVNAKELAVGLSFLCAGNKSTKLSTAFELLDDKACGYLTQRGLTQYLRSYLTMLIGISLLSSSVSTTAETRRLLMALQPSVGGMAQRGSGGTCRASDIFEAVENGAKWTQGYFLRSFHAKLQQQSGRNSSSTRNNAVTFEDFAEWYTEGGYTVAPWLELLDLSKFLSLLPENCESSDGRKASGDGSGEHVPPKPSLPPAVNRVHPSEVLFTFPLANHQSLVVLREDAAYVRTVVTQLGLLSFSCEEIWSSLYKYVRNNPPYWQNSSSTSTAASQRNKTNGSGKCTDVDQATFVEAVDSLVNPSRGKKKKQQSQRDESISRVTLKNFFSSFDLEQVDRVAVNQLMGGLSLLCGGKKSTKLAFSFGLFDGRSATDKRKRGQESQSLNEKELFLFFRSFLIVMFSCCKQSLDLSAEDVSRFISETANMVANDVVMYQWNTRRTERVDFDNFGEWYNKGGFEIAPWLELLDLKKWVLLDGPIDAPSQGETRDGAPSTPSRQHHDEFENSPSRDDLPDNKSQKNEDTSGDDAAAASTDARHSSDNNEGTVSSPAAEDDHDCPPPPPDDAMDPTNDFLGDMGLDGIDDGMDDMDYILQQASHEASETQNKDSEEHQAEEGTTSDKTQDKRIKEESREDTHAPAPSSDSPPPVDSKKRTTKRQPKKNITKTQPRKTNNRAKPVATSNRTHEQHRAHSPPPVASLKFHLLTSEEHKGYMISISQRRIQHLRQLVCESGLYKLDGNVACSRILDKAVKRRQGSGGGAYSALTLTKEEFDSAMRNVVASSTPHSSRGEAGMTRDTQHHLSDLLTSIFDTFDRHKCGKVDALELACGFTVLCGGRKSDKLEYAFELLDEKKHGNYAHNDMIRYLQSFLVVLLSISSSLSLARDNREDVMTTMDGTHCGNGASTILRVIDYGSSWATERVFKSVLGANRNSKSKNNRTFICFDDFAEWYTQGGYTSIPWLELLDLRKWVLADKT